MIVIHIGIICWLNAVIVENKLEKGNFLYDYLKLVCDLHGITENWSNEIHDQRSLRIEFILLSNFHAIESWLCPIFHPAVQASSISNLLRSEKGKNTIMYYKKIIKLNSNMFDKLFLRLDLYLPLVQSMLLSHPHQHVS